MFLPFVSLVFLFVHWKTAAKPFLVSMLGIAILFLSTIFTPTVGTGRGISKFSSGTNRANTNNNNATFHCSGKIYCSEMSSCAEAKFYLRNCPGTKMDGDNDGIPCEKQWCGN
ncbi:MAG: excalibur calcium-binding domain-containing protein [Bacteroidales bacterium]|nr:excalibur calcium-binding domain-containing protein [Bacteroidales bacterium]